MRSNPSTTTDKPIDDIDQLHNLLKSDALFKWYGQTPLILAMQALDYNANLIGVCSGVAHSARDAFLANQFTQFILSINNIYSAVHLNLPTPTLLNSTRPDEMEKAKKHFAEIDVVLNAKLTAINKIINNEKIISDKDEYESYVETLESASHLNHGERVTLVNKTLDDLSHHVGHLVIDTVKKEISEIPPHKLDFLNHTKALFERILLYQSAKLYPDFYETGKAPNRQNPRETFPLVKSNALEQDKVAYIEYFSTNIYTLTELQNFFEIMKKSFKANEPCQPFVINLNSTHHAIMVGYHPKKDIFAFLNFGSLPKMIEKSSEMALNVYTAFCTDKVSSILYYANDPSPEIIQKNKNRYFAVQNPCCVIYVDITGTAFRFSGDDILASILKNTDINNLNKLSAKESSELFQKMRNWIISHDVNSYLNIMAARVHLHLSILKTHKTHAFDDALEKWRTGINDINKITSTKLTCRDSKGVTTLHTLLAAMMANDLLLIKNILHNCDALPDFILTKSLTQNNFGIVNLFLEAGKKITVEHFFNALNSGFKPNATDTCFLNFFDKLNHGTLLYLAIIKNDMPTLDKILNLPIRINEKDALGNTPLGNAIINKRYEMTTKILQKGGDPNIDCHALFPLNYAVKIDENYVTLLLAHGANIELADKAAAQSLKLEKDFCHMNQLSLILSKFNLYTPNNQADKERVDRILDFSVMLQKNNQIIDRAEIMLGYLMLEVKNIEKEKSDQLFNWNQLFFWEKPSNLADEINQIKNRYLKFLSTNDNANTQDFSDDHFLNSYRKFTEQRQKFNGDNKRKS